ncbi:MAG: hypothetical protein ACP5LF_02065 [Nitrososphaeria archaeon]|nr:hypothetical protein [Conexivisphaerales archaeon]
MLRNLDNNSNNIKIKLKKGDWEIEVECPEDKINEIIPKILSSIPIQQQQEFNKESTRKGVTCKDLLTQLWKEGWFSQERSLYEVDEELQRRGYHYDRSAIAHALTDMVREGVLTRVGSPRNYRYSQKYPPQ